MSARPFVRCAAMKKLVLGTLFVSVALGIYVGRALPTSAAPPTSEKIAGTEFKIADLWTGVHAFERLSEIGRGKAVVFSPDISVPANRKFYESLGFAYFEDPSWDKVITEIQAFNRSNPERAIKVLLVQTHGTNGNGLKLQTTKRRDAPRSYISIGALRERLEGTGVRLCIVAACNAGRLFRPEIYNALDQQSADPLFLPPTLGVFNASAAFNPTQSSVTLVRRTENFIEMTHKDDATMFSEATRARLNLGVETFGRKKTRPERFVVSYLLVQLLFQDATLDLTAIGYEEKESRRQFTSKKRIKLLEQFFDYLEKIAAREASARAVSELGNRRDSAQPRVVQDRAWS